MGLESNLEPPKYEQQCQLFGTDNWLIVPYCSIQLNGQRRTSGYSIPVRTRTGYSQTPRKSIMLCSALRLSASSETDMASGRASLHSFSCGAELCICSHFQLLNV